MKNQVFQNSRCNTGCSGNDYYPFGMLMPEREYTAGSYRYGFNGMEKDDEIKGVGNSYDFRARIYDARLGRWLSLDPLMRNYPTLTPYHFGANNPIFFVDVDGRDIFPSNLVKSSVYYGVILKVVSQRENNPFSKKYLEPFITGGKDMKIGYFTFALEGYNPDVAGMTQLDKNIYFNSNKWFEAEGYTDPDKGYRVNELSEIALVATFFHELIHTSSSEGSTAEHQKMMDVDGEVFQGFKQGLLDYASQNDIELSGEQAEALIWGGLATYDREAFEAQYDTPEKRQNFMQNLSEVLYKDEGKSYVPMDHNTVRSSDNEYGEPIKTD